MDIVKWTGWQTHEQGIPQSIVKIRMAVPKYQSLCFRHLAGPVSRVELRIGVQADTRVSLSLDTHAHG